MKIIKYICDRCKSEILTENYWSILIYENADSQCQNVYSIEMGEIVHEN